MNVTKFFDSKISKVYEVLKDSGLSGLISLTLKKITNILIFIVRHGYLEGKREKYFIRYLESLCRSQDSEFFIIIGGKRTWSYSSSRAIKIPEYIAKKGKDVIYLYLDNIFLERDFGYIDNVYYIPVRLFLKIFKKNKCILNEIFRRFSKIYILIELPIAEVTGLLTYFDKLSLKYELAYDIRDNWAEFRKLGEAKWFDAKIEKIILEKSNYVFTVSPKLKEIFINYNPIVLPNGFEPNSFDENYKVNLKKGEITLGYYGHLTPSWFDWSLILEVAKQRKKWIIHLIGSGGGKFVRNLPDNIIYHGKVDHKLLKAYTRDWDVAIIPFKNTLISECSDPLKVYEYLFFGLPVIVQGIPHLSEYPFVYVVSGVSEFIQTVEDIVSKRSNFNMSEVMDFLNKCTWDYRIDDLLENLIKK